LTGVGLDALEAAVCFVLAVEELNSFMISLKADLALIDEQCVRKTLAQTLDSYTSWSRVRAGPNEFVDFLILNVRKEG